MNPFTMLAIVFSAIGRTFRVADKWAEQAELYSDKTIGAQRAEWVKDQGLEQHLKLAHASIEDLIAAASKSKS